MQVKTLLVPEDKGALSQFYFSSHFSVTTLYSRHANEIYISNSVVLTNDGTLSAGVEIITTSKVLMYSFILNNKAADDSSVGYMAYPTKFMGKKYIIPFFFDYAL